MSLISAIYSSPTNPPFTLTLPATSTPTDKTAYLSFLRTAVPTLQDEINRELTARMEEDNKKAGAKAADDVKEEENYGEEVVEEDE